MMLPCDSASNDALILVVDDELVVLNYVCRTLKRAGFHVLAASGGAEALRKDAESARPVDLLLTDVIMPGMRGPALAERFAEQRPGARCLFMAGLSESAEVRDQIIGQGKHFLAKPFVPAALVSKVQDVLAGAAAGAATARA